MSNYQHRHFITDSELVMTGYTPANEADSKVAILWFQGALGAGDLGERSFPNIATKNNISFFYPDYYGSFRSGGKFTIENCAKTVIDSIDALKNSNVKEAHERLLAQTNFSFEKILCVFSSFAGWIPIWIHNHHCQSLTVSQLQNIGWHCPLLDFKRQAASGFVGEESIDEFLFLGRTIYHRTYRGIEDAQWDNFLGGHTIDEPLANLELLSNCKTSIVHGKDDTVIYPEKSEKVHERLHKHAPNSHSIHLLSDEGHGGQTMEQKAIEHYLTDFALI